MNGKERFFSLVAGRPFDRRPFGAILSLYGAKLIDCPPQQYYNDPESYARGQEAVFQAVRPDFLTGPFLLAGFGEAFGGTLRYSENDAPNLRRPAIASAAEIPKLAIPDIDTHPRILYLRRSIRRLAAAHGRDSVIVAIVLNPIDLPAMIMGLEAWFGTILTDREATRRMLDVTVPFFIRLCAALYADGADAIACPMTFFTRDVSTRNLVEEFALPVFREAWPKLQGLTIFHHTGSTIFDHIDLLDPLPGVLGFTMDVDDSLPEARRRIRKESVLFGGLDGPTLHTLSPETVRARSIDILARMKEDGRFVLFATGTDVDWRTPPECLAAIGQAADEFGNG
ncbi:MAG: uroporphyrinogen decarboxylase family protein [Candidatus Aminicenantes bacterium]|nr:uroporphyrinogen decarboxylase family protein [Candidatus Aminicenantes bacterium]